MNWTPTARQELENHLAGLRPSLAGTGADPEEVLDDLRRHVTEEVAAARLPVVTEADVRRFLARAAPAVALGESRALGRQGPENGAEPDVGAKSGSWPRRAALAFFGVALPLFALVFEVYTRACAQEFFDPLPTRWHVLLVALVPLANGLALALGRHAAGERLRLLWVLNGAAVGVGMAYALLFLPLTLFALIGVVFFGLGLLPLAPLLGLVASFNVRGMMGAVDAAERSRLRMGGWMATAAALMVLGGLAAPSLVTRHFARVAMGDEEARAESAVRWLRVWGDRDILLRDCYGFRRGLWDGWIPERLEVEPARQLYFRVTGQPFNAVAAPKTARSRQNRVLFDEFEPGGEEWDSALGGEAVAGRVRGLSMTSSRLDGLCDADAAWAYIEWTLEFRNDHERSQREARAQIQLPAGGVVSRLTLWVNGEEREAAFSGRSHVREAYQKVAVQQRRDPVLVTTSGPDRVLMQCFPVPPNGGTMKVRVGITAPLALEGADRAVLTWPRFLERNFGLARSLEHGLWVETAQPVLRVPARLAAMTDDRGRTGLHGQWTDAALSDPSGALVLQRNPGASVVWAPDRTGGGQAWVRQTIASAPTAMPARVAVVLDTSVGMDGAFREIAAAMAGAPAVPEMAIFMSRDGVSRPYTGRDATALAGAIRDLRGEGGHDAVPALVQGWEWAAAEPGGVVLWLHGPQPVLLSSTDPLRQRLEWGRAGTAPRVIDFQVRPGPNRVIEKLDGLDAVGVAPRWETVQADLERLLASWSGRDAAWRVERERMDAGAVPGTEQRREASSHVTRLWAAGEARRLWRERSSGPAATLAARYQLVTPASGAVVLETRQQFADAGLEPVDPSTVPMVPEPGLVPLLVLGAVMLVLVTRKAGSKI